MYFGYAQMWRFEFVPLGCAFVLLVGTALALVYVVGSTRGKAAAQRYLRFWTWAGVIGTLGLIGWAAVTGDLQRFLVAYGPGTLFELAVLAAMFLIAMWIMAVSYLAGKKDDAGRDDGRAGQPARETKD